MIHKAAIFHGAGDETRYVMELDLAETYAANAGHAEVGATLKAELDAVRETLPHSADLLVVDLKGIVSESNREYLRDLIAEGTDYGDLIGDAYGMIVEEGDDPDEVLARLGYTEQ